MAHGAPAGTDRSLLVLRGRGSLWLAGGALLCSVGVLGLILATGVPAREALIFFSAPILISGLGLSGAVFRRLGVLLASVVLMGVVMFGYALLFFAFTFSLMFVPTAILLFFALLYAHNDALRDG